jgi:8-oxo-dGTP pyrophosphatase MutT (NUDIX family)
MLAGKLDTSTSTIEKQAKIGALLIPHKSVNGQELFLIQQRLKEPYFGYWGFMTGKVRYGETLIETAARELHEETGLSGDFKFCYELHEMVYNKTNHQQLEDKFFQIIEVTHLSDDLINTIEGHNLFVTIDEFRKITPKYHNEDDILTWYLKKDFSFKEQKYYIENF